MNINTITSILDNTPARLHWDALATIQPVHTPKQNNITKAPISNVFNTPATLYHPEHKHAPQPRNHTTPIIQNALIPFENPNFPSYVNFGISN